MKKFLMVSLFLGLFSASAFAADYGVVDVMVISDTAKVMKSLNKQKDKMLEKVQTDVNLKRKEFEKKEGELKAKQAMINEQGREEFMREVTNFQKDVMEYDKQTAKRVADIEKAYVETLKRIQDDYLDGIVKKVGKSKDLDLVINSQSVVVIDPSLDITKPVIEELDNQITEIELKTK